MSIARRPGQQSPSQSPLFSLQSFSWQTELLWASISTDFTRFCKQIKTFAPAIQRLALSSLLGAFHMCCWVEETQALPLSESQDLRRWLPQGHPGASTLTSSLPMSTERFPPHPFSLSPIFRLSLTDNEVYKCCLVSGICLGHQKNLPCSERRCFDTVQAVAVCTLRAAGTHRFWLSSWLAFSCQAVRSVWEEKRGDRRRR